MKRSASGQFLALRFAASHSIRSPMQSRGVHEGLTFAFSMHGAEWKVVVDLQQSWVQFLRKDEYEKGMSDALSRN